MTGLEHADGRPLAGQRAVVTGGSRGIGAEIAVALAEAGATVAVAGRDRAALAQTCARVEEAGGGGIAVSGDLGTEEGARAVAGALLSHADDWDILVNNAALAHLAPLLQVERDDVEGVLAVNVMAALTLAQRLAPGMMARGSGRIINVSSVSAFRCTPGLAAYGLAKAALNHLTAAMAVEWGPRGVLANAICPTLVETDMADQLGGVRRKRESIPLRRYGRPRDVAEMVVFLASGRASFVNGTAIPLDGGLMVAG